MDAALSPADGTMLASKVEKVSAVTLQFIYRWQDLMAAPHA